MNYNIPVIPLHWPARPSTQREMWDKQGFEIISCFAKPVPFVLLERACSCTGRGLRVAFLARCCPMTTAALPAPWQEGSVLCPSPHTPKPVLWDGHWATQLLTEITFTSPMQLFDARTMFCNIPTPSKLISFLPTKAVPWDGARGRRYFTEHALLLLRSTMNNPLHSLTSWKYQGRSNLAPGHPADTSDSSVAK